MLSPVGIRCPTEYERSPQYDSQKEFKERQKKIEEENKAKGISTTQAGRRGPPAFIIPIIRYTWKKRTSPFSVVRFAGKNLALKGINNYI